MAETPEIIEKTGYVDQPKTVEVTVKKRPKTMVAGMEEVVVDDGRIPGYSLKFGNCMKCGEETAIKLHKDDREEYLGCPKCKSQDREKFIQTEETIPWQKVERIINRAVRYKDRTGRLHDNPFTNNTLNDELASNKTRYSGMKWRRGFMCTNCKRIYFKKVKCCTDGMLIKGKFTTETDEWQ